MFPARLELATFRVLGGRDNHYTTETTAAWIRNNLIYVSLVSPLTIQFGTSWMSHDTRLLRFFFESSQIMGSRSPVFLLFSFSS